MALKMRDTNSTTRGSNELNFLGEGTSVEGPLLAAAGIRVDGKVKGAVRAKETLTIGASGVVIGEVEANTVILGGRVEGNMSIAQKIVLESKSVLIGNLKTKSLVIDEGAIFQGKSDMGNTAAQPDFGAPKAKLNDEKK